MKNRFFTRSIIHFVFAALAFSLAFLAVGAAHAAGDVDKTNYEIGRASCRERV